MPITSYMYLLEAIKSDDGSTNCMNWPFSRKSRGYGQLRYPGIATPQCAHVVSFAVTHGLTLPLGIVVRHKCDNTACFKPSHLLGGTQQENTQDGVERGRYLSGSSHPRARLSEAIVEDIRSRYRPGNTVLTRNGPTLAELAAEYGVARATVQFVVMGRTWKSTPPSKREPRPESPTASAERSNDPASRA